MSFYEVQFPQQIAYGAKGGAGWLTRIVSTQAGFEYRSQAWSRTRGKWDVSHGLKTPTDFQTLVSMWFAMQGRLSGFRFRDWNDYQDWGAGTIQLNANGDLQLSKLYTSPVALTGSTPTWRRFISKPIGSTLTLPGGVTVDEATGLTTGATAGQTWTGQFDVPVRFDVDDMQAVIEKPWGSGGTSVASTWGEINVLEIRVFDGNGNPV